MAGESLRQGGMVFVQAMRRTYEHLGMVMVISLLWFGLAALPMVYLLNFARVVPSLFSFLIVALEATFLAGPVTAAVYSVADRLLQDEDATLTDVWHLFRRHYRLSAQVTGAMSAILLILGIDIIVFMQSKVRLLQWLAVLWLYFVAFWFLLTIYTSSLVVYQQVSWLKVLQRAALLVLDNVVVTLLVMGETIVVVVLSFFFLIPVPLLLGGMLAFLHLIALHTLMAKYDIETPRETS